MQHPDKKSSPKKESKKLQTDKQFKDKKVREGQGDSSIYNEDNDKSAYPYEHPKDKQNKAQPEFIDRNAESKDKS